ncbi:MAG: DUF998 domain-containing protein [Candidatus Methanomethylophilaceae archaeon]|jgi:hypothetical membrane protein
MRFSELGRSSCVLYIGILFFAVCWIAGALIDRSWIFGVNTMSELGISDTFAKYLFFAGCVVTGVCISLYGYMEGRETETVLKKYAFCALIPAGVFLIGVGVFTMDYGILHSIFTWLFFGTLYIIMIIYMIYSRRRRNCHVAILTFAILVTGVVLIALTPLAFVEPIFVILFMVWMIVVDITKNTCRMCIG